MRIIRQRQTHVQPGYIRDGYSLAWRVPEGVKNVNHALMAFDLARLPGYPEHTMTFNQWSRSSGGGYLFAGAPYVVRVIQSLSWPSIASTDLHNLEVFFRDVARAQSEQWVWCNPEQGRLLPVRFADANFPEAPEIAPGYHKLSGLRLMIDVNYAGSIPYGTHTYSPSMGTVFAIGSIMMQFPAPSRPVTGYGLSTRHNAEDSSAAQPVVYRDGKTTLRRWKLSWADLDYVEFSRLFGFFATYTRGMLRPFTWYDIDGAARTVRLAEPVITVKQLGYDRFSCDLPLFEDM